MWKLMLQHNKRLFRLVPLVLLLALIISIIIPSASYADPDWYNSIWLFRKKITINSENVSGSSAHNSFPVLISITDDDLKNDAQDDGDDILFTASDGLTKLNHEIESYDETTGNLKAWVMISSLSPTTDTDIYMYYGNAASDNSQDVINVWNSNFKMVQHMEEISGGANAITDSTSNNNDGTDNNTPSFGSTGQIDGAIDFNGSDESIMIADSNSLDITTNRLTLEAWINPATLDTNHRRIVIKSLQNWNLEPYYMYGLWVHQNGLGFGVSTTTTRYWSVNGTLTTGTWQYVAGTYDGSQQVWYINGTAVATNPLTITIGANNQPLFIGKAIGGITLFDGIIDEVRISDSARSADWIKTSYNNQSNPGDFITVFSEEVHGAPTVIGGLVLPVNKATVLAPWICLGIILSLVIARIIFYVRKRHSLPRNR